MEIAIVDFESNRRSQKRWERCLLDVVQIEVVIVIYGILQYFSYNRTKIRKNSAEPWLRKLQLHKTCQHHCSATLRWVVPQVRLLGDCVYSNSPALTDQQCCELPVPARFLMDMLRFYILIIIMSSQPQSTSETPMSDNISETSWVQENSKCDPPEEELDPDSQQLSNLSSSSRPSISSSLSSWSVPDPGWQFWDPPSRSVRQSRSARLEPDPSISTEQSLTSCLHLTLFKMMLLLFQYLL